MAVAHRDHASSRHDSTGENSRHRSRASLRAHAYPTRLTSSSGMMDCFFQRFFDVPGALEGEFFGVLPHGRRTRKARRRSLRGRVFSNQAGPPNEIVHVSLNAHGVAILRLRKVRRVAPKRCMRSFRSPPAWWIGMNKILAWRTAFSVACARNHLSAVKLRDRLIAHRGYALRSNCNFLPDMRSLAVLSRVLRTTARGARIRAPGGGGGVCQPTACEATWERLERVGWQSNRPRDQRSRNRKTEDATTRFGRVSKQGKGGNTRTHAATPDVETLEGRRAQARTYKHAAHLPESFYDAYINEGASGLQP